MSEQKLYGQDLTKLAADVQIALSGIDRAVGKQTLEEVNRFLDSLNLPELKTLMSRAIENHFPQVTQLIQEKITAAENFHRAPQSKHLGGENTGIQSGDTVDETATQQPPLVEAPSPADSQTLADLAKQNAELQDKFRQGI